MDNNRLYDMVSIALRNDGLNLTSDEIKKVLACYDELYKYNGPYGYVPFAVNEDLPRIAEAHSRIGEIMSSGAAIKKYINC